MTSKIFQRIQIATFTLGLILNCCLVASAQATPPSKITGMKIMTYNQHLDTFSKDIVEEKDNEFWNALGLSVFVSVEVTGRPNSYVSGRKMEITVFEGRKVILKRVEGIAYINTGKFYVPAWLYASFCQRVTIKARITGQKQVSTISKTLNFACGE